MWPFPKIIAHRAGGSLTPENTLAAFQCGLNWGFHAVEFDVMLTKDHVPVVIHDEKLGRTVAGEGLVCEMLAKDLVQLDAGSWFSTEYAHCRVPTYLQVLEFCTQHGIWMNVEIKPAAGFEAITGQIVGEVTLDFYRQSGLVKPLMPLFSSFELDALRMVKAVAPTIPRAVLYEEVPNSWQEELQILQAIALHTDHAHLTAEKVALIKQAGFGLCCYTVNDLKRAIEIKGWGVDAIFTDQLDLNWELVFLSQISNLD